MKRVLSECALRGISRIGIVLGTVAHARTGRMITAAYWSSLEPAGFAEAVQPLLVEKWADASFDAWCDQQRPQAIVTSRQYFRRVEAHLARRRICVGRDLHLININADEPGRESGIFQDPGAIGATAVRMVINKAPRNERGIPGSPHTVLTPGVWRDGETLCRSGGAGDISKRSA
jgi:hypothetical protein